MVFANPSKVTRPQLTTRNSHSSSDLCWTHSRCRPLDLSDRPYGTVGVQVSRLLFVYIGFRGILIVLEVRKLDSAVFFITLQTENQKLQPVVISKSFYVQILSLRKGWLPQVCCTRCGLHVDHNFWTRRLQLVSVGVKLETSSTGFLSEILQKVSHLGSDLL